ncbi:MAG: thioredoxin family protein [Prolixibacteraceae bacterium]|nr:thioredoxin family protein [Prolixibacteraceae bacterium]
MVKKFWPLLLVLSFGIFLIIGYVQKDKLNQLISEKMQTQTATETLLSAKEFIQKNYNYAQNGEDYEFTFLEFSSSGCAVCKQMEPVLEEVEKLEHVKVNVVFLHIMNPENLDLMKYYSISAVPMQILLDYQGNEFFRNYGFISTAELLEKFEGVKFKK